MKDEVGIKRVVKTLVACLQADSDVYLNPKLVKEALLKDLDSNGNFLLSEKEVEEFVMGGDDGVVSDRLKQLYPNLNELLDQEF